MSSNCMKNLGIPPTIIPKNRNLFDTAGMFQIERFAPQILDPEFEFDLPKGLNYEFDTSGFKADKYLAKEFQELTNRMRKYNVSISLKKYEFRMRNHDFVEILLFTIEIISF